MRAFPVLLLVAACGSIEERADYVDRRAAAECGQIERCELGFFESEYRDRDDCIDERSKQLDEASDALNDQDCTYVPEQAGACVSRIRSFDCEEWAEGEAASACDLVWNCLEG